MVPPALLAALLLTTTTGLSPAPAPPIRAKHTTGAVASVGAPQAQIGVGPVSAPGPWGSDVRPRSWQPPVQPLRVVRPIHLPTANWLPGHRGVDVGANPGDPVRAAGAGWITWAAHLAGRGVVVVDHGDLRTTYEPVAPDVVPGVRVRAGEVIGVVAPGTGHCGGGDCLHWGLRRGPTYLDPLLLLGRNEAWLRPW